ncbi:flagellar export chaperone FlgN [Buchnera aphidicola]|uniref:Flagellar biosynthesis protein FlgN n=1 Tax=Buchnera aphidicola subsp. Rhopalosiphum maidis TaxID=118109 RepID=A0A3G2I5M3_BUCRM|nr:flagellar export chaperone FlgN [Buchnera aphidicola]AYN24734.1 flagellar biosynthesis protein FlgN [Buchnera aphidicola (Rhopalosiphum maidis)]
MKKLLNILKEMKENIIFLEDLMNQEYDNLLKSKTNIKKIELIIEKKEFFLKKISFLKQQKSVIENQYNIFPPYLPFDELHLCWNEIVSKCSLLKKKNIQNKIVLNQKFYLNQRFLNIFQKNELNKNNITYDFDGNL